MQNSANQVKNCTHASFRMVFGIEVMPLTISRKALPQPADSFFISSKAAISSGGYSRLVTTV